jgi:hypothetical protein
VLSLQVDSILSIDTFYQRLTLYHRQGVVTYPINSSKLGLGEQNNSFKTPRSWHRVAETIGDNLPLLQVFSHRQPLARLYSATWAGQEPDRDWILTRIIRLEGMISGFNQGGVVDTYARYIYIHGCPPEALFDRPRSKGCIRMYPEDIVSLYAKIGVGNLVLIY